MNCYTSLSANSRSDAREYAPSIANNSTDHDAKLGWILVNKELITQTQLDAALNAQVRFHKPVGELLIENHLILEAHLEQALKEQFWRRNGYWII